MKRIASIQENHVIVRIKDVEYEADTNSDQHVCSPSKYKLSKKPKRFIPKRRSARLVRIETVKLPLKSAYKPPFDIRKISVDAGD